VGLVAAYRVLAVAAATGAFFTTNGQHQGHASRRHTTSSRKLLLEDQWQVCSKPHLLRARDLPAERRTRSDSKARGRY
jgi:hypothetical protein